jgi:hypothetical protein
MQSPERHLSSWARECLIIWIWMPSVEPTAACRAACRAVYGAVSGALSIDELGSARVEHSCRHVLLLGCHVCITTGHVKRRAVGLKEDFMRRNSKFDQILSFSRGRGPGGGRCRVCRGLALGRRHGTRVAPSGISRVSRAARGAPAGGRPRLRLLRTRYTQTESLDVACAGGGARRRSAWHRVRRAVAVDRDPRRVRLVRQRARHKP